jgi:hypothetical protein
MTLAAPKGFFEGDFVVTSIHSTHLLGGLPPHPVNGDAKGMNLLMADLQLSLGYLEKKRLRNSARSRTVRRHARHTYNEAVRLLAVQPFSEKNRRQLEAQAAILKDRLAQLGERF